jgi:peptide/nickel transport system permease protein
MQVAPHTLDMMPVDVPAIDIGAPEPTRSFLSGVIRKTVSKTTTRIAIGWILVLTTIAVFAPLIANSHPYLVKLDGHWSSPLLRSLEWIDWTLFAAWITAVVVWLYPLKLSLRLLIIAAVFLGVGAATRYLIHPRTNIIYGQYREARAAGHVGYVLNAPVAYSASDYLREQHEQEHLPPSKSHWMGTDDNSGDVFSRLLHACRVASTIGLVSTAIAVTIGIFVGGLMGYFAGLFDILGMRVIEVFEAIPTLFLMITLIAFFPSEDIRFPMLIVIIGVTGWTGYARYLRAEVLRLRNQDYVHAAIASGLSLPTVLFKHILPNAINPVVIAASFSVAGAIVYESTLSYLGVGLVDQPSWGGMLAQSLSEGGEFHWWLAFFPGMAIFVTVFAWNLLGEALGDALDPKRI